MITNIHCDRYLYQFLYGWLVSTLNRADNMLFGNDSPVDSQKNRTKRNKPKKKKSHPYSQEIILCHAMQSLTGAYFKVINRIYILTKY